MRPPIDYLLYSQGRRSLSDRGDTSPQYLDWETLPRMSPLNISGVISATFYPCNIFLISWKSSQSFLGVFSENFFFQPHVRGERMKVNERRTVVGGWLATVCPPNRGERSTPLYTVISQSVSVEERNKLTECWTQVTLMLPAVTQHPRHRHRTVLQPNNRHSSNSIRPKQFMCFRLQSGEKVETAEYLLIYFFNAQGTQFPMGLKY